MPTTCRDLRKEVTTRDSVDVMLFLRKGLNDLQESPHRLTFQRGNIVEMPTRIFGCG